MRRIVAKASSAEACRDKLCRGADSLEIQLIELDFDKEDRLKEFLPYADKISSVHTPLSRKRGVCIYDTPEMNREVLRNTFYLANRLAAGKAERIGVVVHQDISYGNALRKGCEDNAEVCLECLEAYPGTSLLIENTSILNMVTTDYDEPIMTAQKLIEKAPEMKDRIRVLIDTIHLTMASRTMYDETEDIMKQMELVIARNSSLVGQVHLANCIGCGCMYTLKHNHGCDFDEASPEQMYYFNRLMQILTEKVPDADLCIEVSEKDYRQGVNFAHIRRLVRQWQSGMKLPQQ